MKFPGDNEIRLSYDTVLQIISNHVRSLVGEEARIVRISHTSGYGNSGMTVDFTSDPPPPPRAPAPPPTAPQALNVDDVINATSPVSLKTSDEPL